MTATWHIGDTRTILCTLPDQSVDLVLTSPPFLALRSYLPADDPNKPLEMGSEATPGEFIDGLLDVVEECRRVLAPHGSLCFELGDTYAGSGGGGGDYLPGGLRENQPGFGGSAERQREGNAAHWRLKNQQRDAWPLDKSLCLIPESFRWALAYGRNPFTGRTTPPWRVRNVVRWCRPNPPVGALADKFRPATSDMVIACTSRSRYFDLDAVRTPSVNPPGVGVRPTMARTSGADANDHRDTLGPFTEEMQAAGAPPLDWWRIPTQPYRGAHYATWPEELCRQPILAMCPQKVCTVCGEPSRRIVGEATYEPSDSYRGGGLIAEGERVAEGANQWKGPKGGNASVVRSATTLGWSDCGHDAWRTGIVLDPFAGSGTTLAVAVGHGRHAVGIDLDERNYHLARERIGMFLTLAETAPMGGAA